MNKKSPKDLRYNCILWLATHKQHTHSQIQANIGNQIEEEEEEWTVWYDLEEGKNIASKKPFFVRNSQFSKAKHMT